VTGGEEIREDIELDAGGILVVRVKDPGGRPLQKVKVGLSDEEGEPARYWIRGQDRAETDENGELRLTGLEPGRYRLSLHIEAELWESRQVEVPAGEQVVEIEIDR
jgi:protocatechuate 3,4-dioxygenase beta subunit